MRDGYSSGGFNRTRTEYYCRLRSVRVLHQVVFLVDRVQLRTTAPAAAAAAAAAAFGSTAEPEVVQLKFASAVEPGRFEDGKICKT